MKRSLIIIWIVIIIFGGFGIWKLLNTRAEPPQVPNQENNTASTPISYAPVNVSRQTKALFVPYWSLTGSEKPDNSYTSLLYFGVETTSQGVNKNESGYKNLQNFDRIAQSVKNKLLVVRMLDNKENDLILGNSKIQTYIIDQSIDIAKQNKFNGLVIDLELSALPFDSLVQQINSFNDRFRQITKKNKLSYGIMMYGDVFYRARPFDMKYLSGISDQIYVMAYDLHKANGDPGPNFPMYNSDYDLEKMINSFLTVTAPDKLTVVWGLFGYDWQVNETGIATLTAQSLSFLQIKRKFLTKCDFSVCVISRDKDSAETVIHYQDNENSKHVVWFDDLQSVKQKQTFLLSKGISHFGYWAWSYF